MTSDSRGDSSALRKQTSRDLSAERSLKKREVAKELEQQVAQWIEAVTGCTQSETESLQTWLSDGVVLCSLANKIKPGIVPEFTRDFGGNHNNDSIREARRVAQQDENINRFIKAAIEMGVKPVECFELKHMRDTSGAQFRNVTNALHRLDAAIKTTCPKFIGPFLSSASVRRSIDFSPLTPTKDERIRTLETHVAGLQASKEQHIQELEATVSALQAERRSERSKAEANAQELQSELRDLKSESGAKDERVKELTSALKDMEAAKDKRIKELEAAAVGQTSLKDQRIQELEATVVALQAERSKTEEQTKGLETQLADLKNGSTSKDGRLKDLTASLKDAEVAKDKQVKDLEAAVAGQKSLKEQIKGLEKQLVEQTTESSTKDERIKDLAAALKDSEAARDRRISELEAVIAEKQGKKDGKDERIAELEKTVAELTLELEDTSSSVSSMKSRSEAQIKELKLTVSNLREHITALQVEGDNAQRIAAAKRNSQPLVLLIYVVAALFVGYGLAEFRGRPAGYPQAHCLLRGDRIAMRPSHVPMHYLRSNAKRSELRELWY